MMPMIVQFFIVFKDYLIEVLPFLAVGFFLSGLINEFVPTRWVEGNLGGRGIKPLLYSILGGAVLPICCWGSLPVAVSLHQKGARLGPVLAFLVATPATSVSALLVCYALMGIKFTVFIFLAVILMGMVMGIIGNLIRFEPKGQVEEMAQDPVCGMSVDIEGAIKEERIRWQDLVGLFRSSISNGLSSGLLLFNDIGGNMANLRRRR
jgi:hypothetical protein